VPEKLPALFRAIAAAGRKGGIEKAQAALWKRFGTTCSMLVLDSTGFTRTSRTRGIVYFLDKFLGMREIVGPVFESHKCIAWRSAADNLFAEFAAPDRALEAALSAHLAVAESGLMLSDKEPYRVCIGIGYGRVLRGDAEGVFGDEMNLACKLGEDVAAGGETLLTESAYRALKSRKSVVFERRSVAVSGNDILYYAARR
jgi:class 3 adenylate cyclase